MTFFAYRMTVTCMVWAWVVCAAPSGEAGISGAGQRHGPEVRSFLSFLKQEEDELRFHVGRNEITQKEYTLSMNRIAVLRSAVLAFVKKTGKDRVPEYHVVTADEITQLVPEEAVNGAKPGVKLSERWRYVGEVTRGEHFYILERLTRN